MKRNGLLFLLCVFAVSCFATDSLIEKVAALNKGNNYISSAFTETKVMPRIKKETKKYGNLYFVRESEKLMMRYTDPEGDYSLIENGTMYVRRGDKTLKFGNTQKDGKMSVFKSSLIYAMKGEVASVAAENEAEITSEQSDTQYIFTLKRQNNHKVGVKQITLIYDKSTGALVVLKIEESNGNYTSYETPKPDTKTKLEDKVFAI